MESFRQGPRPLAMSSTVESQGQARTNTGTCIVCYTHQHTIQIKILNSDNTGTYINTVRRSGTWQVMERGFKAAFCLFQFPAACCRIKICVQPSLLHHPDPGTSTHSRRINSFCKNTLEFKFKSEAAVCYYFPLRAGRPLNLFSRSGFRPPPYLFRLNNALGTVL